MTLIRPFVALPARLMLPLLLAVFTLPYGFLVYTDQIQRIDVISEFHETQRLTDRISDAQTRLEVQIAHNPFLARRIVSALALHDNLEHAWLIDEQGMIIASLNRRDIGQSISNLTNGHAGLSSFLRSEALSSATVNALQTQRINGTDLLLAQVPVKGSGKLIAVADLAPSSARLLHDQLKQVLLEIGALLVLAVMIGFTIHVLWFRRSAQLLRTAREFGRGNLAARAKLQGNDELAKVSRAFDDMADQISSQHQQLSRLAEVIDHSPVVAIVWSASPGWPAVFVSNNIRQWGFEPEAFTSSTLQFSHLIHPDDLARIEAEVSHYITHGPDEYIQEYRICDAAGRWFWIEDRTWLTRDAQGEVLSIQGILLDIESRKQAEQALRESEERLRLALAGAQQGLYDLDLTTGEAKVSPEYASMMGYDPDTFRETHLAWRARLHPDDAAAVFDTYDAYVAGKLPEYRVEFRMRTQDKRWKWLLSIGKIVKWSDNGTPLRMLGTHTDIDALKRAQDALRELNTTLETRIEERTAELHALNQSLESFVYSVSHDLKAPLRGVEGYSRLLEEDYLSKLDEDGKHFIRSIRQGISRMGDLIDDLLAYSRMERKALASRAVELRPLTEQLADELLVTTRQPDQPAVIFTNDLPAVCLQADADGLTMVLRNLIENASKFSSTHPEPAIQISGHVNDDGTFTFSVCDNGIGFDMKYHDRIFEIFQRLHRLEDYPGTGIGLALVKKAVQRMGGKVWAESTPGNGACFFVTLPLAESVQQTLG